MKLKTRSRDWVFLAALAAGAAWPALGWAQYRVDNGNALDANNRVDSGGYNAPRPAPTITGNDIVYGTVSGGREFRGGVPYSDPRAFTGRVSGGNLDRFVAGSAGAPTPFAPRTDLTIPQPFYGESRAAPPPPGYVKEGFNPGYIPAQLGSTITRSAITPDTRLGAINETPAVTLPTPAQASLPGPVEIQEQPSFITASPLAGIRRLNAMTPDQLSTSNAAQQGTDRLAPAQAGQPGQMGPNSPSPDSAQPGTSPANPSNLLQPIQPKASSVGTPALNDALPSSTSGQSPLRQQYVRNVVRTPATQQSSQYAEMQTRLQNWSKQRGMSDEEAQRQFLTQLQKRQEADRAESATSRPSASSAKRATPSGKTAAGKGTARVIPPSDILAPETPPVQVQSMATGVKSKDLAERLEKAETLMHEGKFTSAIEQYDAADQLAPGNPLVLLGRAHAELGGSFFVQADAHLRQAILADPAVLMGIYDLKQMVGEDRLTKIVDDLKKIAADDPRQARPVFLLTYIAYNTGSSRLASQWLAEAQRRDQGSEKLYNLLRTHWNLPATQPADLNK